MARRINLVPQAERARTTTNVAMLGFFIAVVVVLAGLGFGWWSLHNTLGDREQELVDLEQETVTLLAQVAALQGYEALAAERQATEKVVQSIYAGRTIVASIMDQMSLVVPENVWFETLDLTTLDPGTAPELLGGSRGENRMSLQGNTYSFEDVAQLLVRLQLIPGFGQINLINAGNPTGNVDPSLDVKGFSIEASVTNTQSVDTPLPVSQVEVEGS